MKHALNVAYLLQVSDMIPPMRACLAAFQRHLPKIKQSAKHPAQSFHNKSILNKKIMNDCNIKYILVTGGVISGVGKGVIASSFGTILKCCGIHVSSIKIDPYINIDAGTFSPYEHGKLLNIIYFSFILRVIFVFSYKKIVEIVKTTRSTICR